jgi:hypothetical protein
MQLGVTVRELEVPLFRTATPVQVGSTIKDMVWQTWDLI